MREPYSRKMDKKLARLDREICATSRHILSEHPEKNMPEFSTLLHKLMDIHRLLERLQYHKQMGDVS